MNSAKAVNCEMYVSKNELSSRPERSVVEGPAVRSTSIQAPLFLTDI